MNDLDVCWHNLVAESGSVLFISSCGSSTMSQGQDSQLSFSPLFLLFIILKNKHMCKHLDLCLLLRKRFRLQRHGFETGISQKLTIDRARFIRPTMDF